MPDQVQFRLDFPAWVATRSQRDRAVAVEMAKGEKTLDLANRFKLSPSRISQLRREFHDDWHRFCEELPAGN